MRIFIKQSILVALTVFFSFLLYSAHAQNEQPFEFLREWFLSAPDRTLGIMRVGHVLGIILNILLGSALAISMIAIILSGIKYVTSRGNDKAKGAAQSALTNSIIAFILAIGAFTVKSVIINLIGGSFLDLLNATPSF